MTNIIAADWWASPSNIWVNSCAVTDNIILYPYRLISGNGEIIETKDGRKLRVHIIGEIDKDDIVV